MDECGLLYITSHFEGKKILIGLSLGETINFEELPPVTSNFYLLCQGTVLEITV